MIRLLRKKNAPWNGAWEERGVIGTRIEIDTPDIVVLWRNAPVLKTTFHTKVQQDGSVLLCLADTGMRYENAQSVYAQMQKLLFRDGRIEMTEWFPISGESRATLDKTENSRYGNCDIVDEVLKELAGEWKDADGYFTLRFRGDEMTLNGRSVRVHVTRPRGGGMLRIIDVDPSRYGVLDFGSMEYDSGRIRAIIPVCDAPSASVVFHKV